MKKTAIVIHAKAKSKAKPPEKRGPVIDGGATRCADVAGDSGEFPARYDLIFNNPRALKRLAQTYGEGAAKYGPRNWLKGFPESNLLNHALAHLQMHMSGDKSEDHLSHSLWNIFTLMHFQETRPDLMDLTGPSTHSA